MLPGRRRSRLDLPVPVEEEGRTQQTLVEENVTVNEIRAAVGRWRKDGYPQVTAVTGRLLDHWTDDDPDKEPRPFFAQVEALETLIYLTEVAPWEPEGKRLLASLKEANDRYNDGIQRWAVKMATGTGKTAVMGMTIAWQTLNAAAAAGRKKRRARFHKNFLAITPGLTVKERLAELVPSAAKNVYDDMNLVPPDLRAAITAHARVSVHNFHRFKQRHRFRDQSAAEREAAGVAGKEHIESVYAMMARLMPDIMGSGEPVCVLNDEAHHCYNPSPTSKSDKDEKERAALWFNALKSLDGLDVLGAVYDCSATPLFIDRSDRSTPPLFPWVVSDYPLIDAVEAGLVKIPRVPVADDSGGPVAARNLFRAVQRERGGKKTSLTLGDLPSQLKNEVDKLYGQYRTVSDSWAGRDAQIVPPVMIVVADDIKNAEVFYRWLATDAEGRSTSFGLFSNDEAEAALIRHEEQDEDEEGDDAPKPVAGSYPPARIRTLLVHSRIEGGGADDDGSVNVGSKTGTALMHHQAQMLVPGSKKKDAARIMREALNTVGKPGGLGQNVRCVVSVAMLTEGWDTKTVTHIVGYRAFGTQLLCEQVTGRALRRLDYRPDDGGVTLPPIYAEVVGVPFQFDFPEGDEPPPPPDPPISYEVCVMPERTAQLICWPNLIGYARAHAELRLIIDVEAFGSLGGIPRNRAKMTRLIGTHGEPLVIAQDDPQASRLRSAAARVTAAVVERVRLGECAGYTDDSRMIARADLYQQMFAPILTWLGEPPTGFAEDDYDLVNYRQSLVAMVEAVMPGVSVADDDGEPMPKLARFNEAADVLTTEVAPFDAHRKDHYPANLQQTTRRSHLNVAPCDSQLEVAIAAALDDHPDVDAWVRNYKLGWTIPWFNEQRGRWADYIPDFVARVGGGPDDAHTVHLIVEGKGIISDDSQAKKLFTCDWWIPAVENAAEVLGPQAWEFWEYSPQQELGADYRANLAEEMNAAIARCLTRSRELKLSTPQFTERS